MTDQISEYEYIAMHWEPARAHLNIKYQNMSVGQFGTRQYGTGQFGTKSRKRTIWHQELKADNLAHRQFGTMKIWHQELKNGQFGTRQFVLI